MTSNCRGEFRLSAAGKQFRHNRLHPPDLVEGAARTAALGVGRELLAPMTRGPWEAMTGDRSFTWRLTGQPGLIAKVLATSAPGTVRMWRRSLSIMQRLRPPSDLCAPQVRLAGEQPVPWCVMDAAAGKPTFIGGISAEKAYDIALAIQRSRLDGFRFLRPWNTATYVAQIERPAAQLVAAEVITAEAGRRVSELVAFHRRRVIELRPVLAHNDLALYHVFVGGPTPWVIDWESAVYDSLQMLDVAHLIVSHGVSRPNWARQLAAIALEHSRDELGVDLTSNLVIAMLERAVGRALDYLSRRHQQSVQAVEALCAVIEGEFLADGRPSARIAPGQPTIE